MKEANLILISPEQNNNRQYLMTDLGNGFFQAEYGRVGATMMKKKYPMTFWDEVYQKQINQGYMDRKKDLEIKSHVTNGFRPIEDKDVSDFINFLLSCTKKKVENNYSVSHEQISEKMIEEARRIIHEISLSSELEQMKALYIDLYKTVPRKMKEILLPVSIEAGQKMAVAEQDLLDNLVTVKRTKYDERKTILESNGLEVRAVSDKEAETIRKYMGEAAVYFKRAFRVKNLKTEALYEQYCRKHGIYKPNFLYHGSANTNYWGIMTEGMSLNPNAVITGKMFGFGLYFAPKATKSIGYTDLDGSYWRKGIGDKAYLAVFKLAYKDPYHTETCRRCQGIHEAPDGKDAVFAHAGVQLWNDEVIVYHEEQATIQYMIELHT